MNREEEEHLQTFLPWEDFSQSAACLDRQRLGKQRVEAYQILRQLRLENGNWRHHPAVKMWEGWESALLKYAFDVCAAWRGRGYRDGVMDTLEREFGPRPQDPPLPWWIGRREFHRSHRSNLVRKDPKWYGPLFPDVPRNLEYWWPSRHMEERSDGNPIGLDARGVQSGRAALDEFLGGG